MHRPFMWYKNVGRKFFRFVTIHAFDGQSDGETDRQTDGRTDGFVNFLWAVSEILRLAAAKSSKFRSLLQHPVIG